MAYRRSNRRISSRNASLPSKAASPTIILMGCAVVLAIAGALYFRVHGRAKAPVATFASASSPTRSLGTSQTSSVQVGTLPHVDQRQAGTGALAVRVERPQTGPEPSSANAPTAEPPLKPQQDRWSAEEPNSDWTSNTKQYFTDTLASQNAAPGLLRSVDCRETLCRVVLGEDDLAALRSLETSLKTDGYRFAYAFGEDSQITAFLDKDVSDRPW